MDICGDNRFEIIERAKKHLLDATNIDTSADEMKVLDDFLFRCWQMGWLDRYDTADTPQTDCDKCIWSVCNYNKVDWDTDTPLTDAEITELAKEIVHTMIDNSDIAEDAYPDLRQRMHEAVERLDEYYPSEDEGASR